MIVVFLLQGTPSAGTGPSAVFFKSLWMMLPSFYKQSIGALRIKKNLVTKTVVYYFFCLQ